MKILTVVGARPQFIKAAAVSPILRQTSTEILVHTGQHYDHNMSDVFFEELGLPNPDYNLGIGSGPHGQQTGRMIEALETVMLNERPDWVLVYGDTNSTLAAALAAAKLNIRVAHIEAGLRSFNREMPEEVNRIAADHLSDILFAPTPKAIENLSREGLHKRSVLTGDVMADILLKARPRLSEEVLNRCALKSGTFALLTLHRPSNVDDQVRLSQILSAVREIGISVVFVVHPRTQARLCDFGLETLVKSEPFSLLEPQSYTTMLALQANARVVLTDSGGVQKEAYILGIPCITLRSETEWTETVDTGWNILAGDSLSGIPGLVISFRSLVPSTRPSLFGDGDAAQQIVDALLSA